VFLRSRFARLLWAGRTRLLDGEASSVHRLEPAVGRTCRGSNFWTRSSFQGSMCWP
jgi:hypothetical protein